MACRSYVCEICGKPISVSRYRKFNFCYDHRCRIASCRAFWERVRKGKLCGGTDMQKATRALVPAAKQAFGVEPGDYAPVVVPTNSRQIVNLPESRKRAFRDNLMLRISAAAARRASQKKDMPMPGPAGPKPDPADDKFAVSLNACATCKGRCCKPGHNNALISADTILRFMRENPDLRPRDVLQAYLSRLPSKAYDNSCVYHAADGCALPRHMRSSICNNFLCPNMAEIQKRVDESESRRFFVIASSGKVPTRASYIDGSQIVHISR